MKKFSDKFKETYAGLRKDSKRALMYNSYFLMRRLLYATSLVFLEDFPFYLNSYFDDLSLYYNSVHY